MKPWIQRTYEQALEWLATGRKPSKHRNWAVDFNMDNPVEARHAVNTILLDLKPGSYVSFNLNSTLCIAAMDWDGRIRLLIPPGKR